MQETLQFQSFEVGILKDQSSIATLDHDQGPRISRLFVTVKSTSRDFLIDTGAKISVTPTTLGNSPYMKK